jgi:hypothetical protein
VLRGQVCVNLFELMNVVGSVVGREGHAGQDNAGSGLLEGGDHPVQVFASGRERQTAEAVIAAEFQQHDRRFQRCRGIDAGDAAFSGIAADAEVRYMVRVTARIEIFLQVIGEALAGGKAESGADAIAENDQDLAIIGRGIGGFGRSGTRVFRAFVRGRFVGMIASADRDSDRGEEKIPHLLS